MQYAGTGALKSDFTRTGKSTTKGNLKDGVNSISRYYINNFRDRLRQVRVNYKPSRRCNVFDCYCNYRSVLMYFWAITR